MDCLVQIHIDFMESFIGFILDYMGGVTQKGPLYPESVSYKKKDGHAWRVAAPALLLV